MFERYAIFFTPAPGALSEFGAAWLGWDSAAGCAVPHPDIRGLDIAALTETPRKYGFHATLKAPFRLRDGTTEDALRGALAGFAARQPAPRLAGLALRHQHGFIALRPVAAAPALQQMAASLVQQFDQFRAPLTQDDIARRRRGRLSARQDRQMLDWGYPFVFEDFHFHMTLTGRVPKEHSAQVMDALQPILAPVLDTPFVIDAVTVMGQAADGLFRQIERYPLTG